MLTKFINIETLSFQWMIQGEDGSSIGSVYYQARILLFKKKLLEEIGVGSKSHSRRYRAEHPCLLQGYEIAFMPKAVAWEQEPRNLKRMANKNPLGEGQYLCAQQVSIISSLHASGPIILGLVYRLVETFLFFSAIIISDVIFVLGLLGIDKISLPGNFIIIWVLAYILFILEISINLTMEKGELNFHNTLLVMLMYFTYCQCWIRGVCSWYLFLYKRCRF